MSIHNDTRNGYHICCRNCMTDYGKSLTSVNEHPVQVCCFCGNQTTIYFTLDKDDIPPYLDRYTQHDCVRNSVVGAAI